jgi:golgi SNAP receptor complex member 2
LEIRGAVERYLKTTFSTRKERRDREALLGGGGHGAADTVAVDAFLQERGHLASSHTMLDEISSAAENVMGSLKTQRGVLKGVHRKVLDVGMRLGVSSSVMKLIERRTTGDKVIVYGGMTVLLLLLWIVVSWRASQ